MGMITEEIVKISRGNPGAAAFAIDAVNYNLRDARRVFSRMESIAVVGDKLYMLWNDCCDRKTLLTMAIAMYAPEEIILSHINYENGRGIPFLDSEFERCKKMMPFNYHAEKLRVQMKIRKPVVSQLDIRGMLCERLAEKLSRVVDVREIESFEEHCVVYEAEVTVLTREDKICAEI